MLNHARTLLLNVPGMPAAPITYPGEEQIPELFQPITLVPALTRARNLLFGTNPDRLMLNYRLRQYMTLLHSTDLGTYVTALDPRVTYWPVKDDVFFSNYGPIVSQYSGATKVLYLHGNIGITATDKLAHAWDIQVVNATDVLVTQTDPVIQSATYNYTVTDSLSSLVNLIGSDLYFNFETGVGSKWTVTIYARPAQSLADVLNALVTSLSSADQEYIFRTTDEEPFITFRELWFLNRQLPYRLGGLLLAVIYRIEGLR